MSCTDSSSSMTSTPSYSGPCSPKGRMVRLPFLLTVKYSPPHPSTSYVDATPFDFSAAMDPSCVVADSLISSIPLHRQVVPFFLCLSCRHRSPAFGAHRSFSLSFRSPCAFLFLTTSSGTSLRFPRRKKAQLVRLCIRIVDVGCVAFEQESGSWTPRYRSFRVGDLDRGWVSFAILVRFLRGCFSRLESRQRRTVALSRRDRETKRTNGTTWKRRTIACRAAYVQSRRAAFLAGLACVPCSRRPDSASFHAGISTCVGTGAS